MKTLLDDYKRKLKNMNELISKQCSNGSIVHQRREERLNTRADEYSAFIVDIERAMARQKEQKRNDVTEIIYKVLRATGKEIRAEMKNIPHNAFIEYDGDDLEKWIEANL